MPANKQPVRENNLPPIHRHITSHNDKGEAIFVNEPVPEAKFGRPVNGADFFQAYVTNTFPVKVNEEKDLETYKHYTENPPGLSVPGGSVCRFVDFWPGSPSAMHRTESLDYGVVLEGQLELTLDSGEKRIMNRGDVCVQRATNHAWRNTSDTEWARMMFVLLQSEAVEIGGKKLGEHIEVFRGGLKPSM